MNEFIEILKTYFFLNNNAFEYLKAFLILIASLIFLKIFQKIVLKRLYNLSKKTKNDFDDKLIEIISNLKPPFYLLISFYVSLKTLNFNNYANKIIQGFFIIVISYEIIKALQKLLEYGAEKIANKNNKDKVNKATVRTLSLIFKIILWCFGTILILSNLGVNVSSLIAGLGIGGIAIALALQNILGDIFSSFSILIDKPFEIGDFIKIGNETGTVEKIGIKTTKLRALDGQELIIANKELTSARIENFKRLTQRRSLFNIGVVYETEKEKLEKIPTIIEDIIKKIPQANFDRCHLKSFGESSIDFEISYYIELKEYKEYLDIIEKVNLEIIDIFRKEKIEFAYPTQVEYQKSL